MTATPDLVPGEATNRARAEEDASFLLSQVQLPPGATLSSVQPAGTDPALEKPASSPFTPKLIDLPIWSLVPGEPQGVLSWIEAHAPPGSSLEGTGSKVSAPGGVEARLAWFRWPPVAAVLGTRRHVLEVVVGPEGSTVLRADAQVTWIVPWTPSEQIPTAARVLNVRDVPGRAPRSFTIAKARAVRKIAAIVNGLPIVSGPNRNSPP